MKKTNVLLILTAILLIVCGFYFFSSDETEPAPVAKDRPELSSTPRQTTLPPMETSGPEDQTEIAYPEYERESATEALVEPPKDIEEIKKQVYALEIEYVEDIQLLDDVVQTGDAHTEDLWMGGWVSVDDWKEEVNGFHLEPQADGTFIFYPDEATARTYTFFETPRTYMYDPVKREFYWDMEYYGKTISHVARFINDTVLAMMLISGDKVTLDLYQKRPAKSE